MRKLLILALLPLAGCATQETAWEGTGNFSQDRGYCQAQAFGTPFANQMQIAMVYSGCMNGRGWALVPKRS